MSAGFIHSIDANRIHVLEYEKREFQNKVLRVVPLKRLNDAALNSGATNGLTFHEYFMKEVSAIKVYVMSFKSLIFCAPDSNLKGGAFQ